MFGRFVFHDVPVVKIFPVAICRRSPSSRARLVGPARDRVRAARLRGRGQSRARPSLRACAVDIGADRRLRHFRACGGDGGNPARRIRRRLGRRRRRPRAAGDRRLRRRRGAAHGRARHASSARSRARSLMTALVHAADATRLAATAEGDGAGTHSDYRGRVRRLAPTPRGIAGARRSRCMPAEVRRLGTAGSSSQREEA